MKISIIGTGRLGGLIAFLVADRGLADELVLIDVNKDHAEGQALDLRHAFLKAGKNIKISSGDYAAAKGSQIVIVTAGKPRTAATSSRSELLAENAKIIRQISKEIKSHCFGAVLITTTNPVDPINYILWKETGSDRSKIIGFGGLLDSGRLGAILSEEIKTTFSYEVMGEHGENMVPLFTRLKVHLSGEQKEKIRSRLLGSAKEVIEKKGATEYGPASHILRIVEAITGDKKETLPCSCILEGEYGISDVSLGVPAIIGKEGIEKIEEWRLDSQEAEMLKKAAEKVRGEVKQAEETLV
ncbi:Malate dehydrogenase [uncultured archaeon]|nr:Malate dehydrogenase [uncultured archaeon]